MSDNIADVVHAAQVLGLKGEERDQFILDSGNSLDAYHQYMKRETVKVIAILGSLVAGIVGTVVWWFWDQWGTVLQ